MTEVVSEKIGRKEGVTKETHDLRVKTSVNLKLQGRSYESILTEINRQATGKHWGIISMSQLKKDVARHFNYKMNYSTREELEILEGERLAYVAELERNMQMQYSLIIRSVHYYQNEFKLIEEAKLKNEKLNKPVFSKGQINFAWQILLNMGEHYCRIKGWDKEMNNINLIQNNINNNNIKLTYDRGIEDIGNLPDATKQGLTDFFERFCDESEESDGQEITEGVVQQSEEVAVSESVNKDIH
ncbi:MAG: hypothetical protein KAT66_00565 [Candidatus Lokiarchaeota archaeon]|nr:hypothetical protein [Candidatus Lokiarchaeota archaeon]